MTSREVLVRAAAGRFQERARAVQVGERGLGRATLLLSRRTTESTAGSAGASPSLEFRGEDTGTAVSPSD